MIKPNLIIKIIVLVVALSFSVFTQGQVNGDYQTRATGNWNANATWQVRSGGAWVNCSAGDYPGATSGAGTVNILSGHNVTLNISPANTVGALTFAAGNSNSVAFGSNWTLTISGNVTYTTPNANNTETLNVATGTLNCGAVVMSGTGNNNRVQTLLLSSGVINVGGNITMVNATQNAIAV